VTPVAWSASLRTLAARFGDAAAIIDGHGARLSYRALDARAHALAGWLVARGAGAGTPVAALLPNAIDAVWVAYGIRLAGCAEVPLSWGYTDSEIAWTATVARYRLVLTRAERVRTLQELELEAADVATLDAKDVATLEATPPAFPAVAAGVASRILFTSGTTGRPKGVVYSHGRRWIGEQLLKATLPFVPQPDARLLIVTPFPHGASLLTFAWCDHGGTVLLEDGVDPARIRSRLLAGVDALFAPPTVLAKLSAALGRERFDGVRCVFTGTQPLGATLYQKAHAMFGPVVRVTYGKTECVNPIAVLPPDDTADYFGRTEVPSGACVGWAAPGVDLDVRDGEVWLRAPQMSDHLLGPDGPIPHAEGGWHATGDLGHFDERGRLVLDGRVADVIKTGGYRVNPDEIESLLTGMDCCGPVCVAGVPSDYWGEVIVAVAEQARSGWVAEVEARVAPLSRHKRPRLHVALDALPRNAQGKVSRREVVRRVLASHGLADGAYPALVPTGADAAAPPHAHTPTPTPTPAPAPGDTGRSEGR
jgi:acyl-CoA synthetase (AMP-forming)/AMP-acid ligase II